MPKGQYNRRAPAKEENTPLIAEISTITENPEPLKREPEIKPTLKLTPEQERIASIIINSDDDWKTITEDDITDYSLGNEPYPLPEEAKKLQNERRFAFRWILNDWTRLQEVMRQDVPLRWWPCNSTNTSYLKKYIDSTDGAVHCKDQILVFKPWWMHQKYKDSVSGVDEAQLKSNALQSKHGMTEEHGSEWRAGKEVRIEGRDDVMQVADDI